MGSKDYHKEYYKNNKDKWALDTEEKRARKRANDIRYWEDNREVGIERRKQWTKSNFIRNALGQAKKRAKQKGIDFDITYDDIIQNTHCPYLGIELTETLGQGIVWSNKSLDRIDNTKGYVKGNVEVISWKANSIKSNATIDELVKFSKSVLEKF